MADLGVSRETVRRDLLDLEALGELRRVHGGAIKPADEAPIAERVHMRVKSKTAIAKAATRLIASGQTLFIDAGTTTAGARRRTGETREPDHRHQFDRRRVEAARRRRSKPMPRTK